MNYRDMLLQDYFDESYDDYDSFNESKQSDALKTFRKSREKNNIDPLSVSSVSVPTNRNLLDFQRTKEAKQIALYLGKDPYELTRSDVAKFLDARDSAQKAENQYTASKAYKKLAADKLQAANTQQQREKSNAAAGVSWENLSSKPKVQAEYDRQLQAIARSNGWTKGQPMSNFISEKDKARAVKATKNSTAYKNAANTARQEHSQDEKFRKTAARVGAADAAAGAAPSPSKISQAKAWASGHKKQLAIAGGAAAGVAGAGVTAAGVKSIADLKNTAKAKAAWKASGSNLPFEEWRKKQLTKAGIKTGIGAALTAAGAGGAAYAGLSKKFNEAEDLMFQYELVELEEAYLEGYYGQVIAENAGFESEAQLIAYAESMDSYDDYDEAFDEDLELPYFG